MNYCHGAMNNISGSKDAFSGRHAITVNQQQSFCICLQPCGSMEQLIFRSLTDSNNSGISMNQLRFIFKTYRITVFVKSGYTEYRTFLREPLNQRRSC